MPAPVTAKPQGFVLKMRLVAPDGAPFAGKKYRVKWGPKLIPEPPLPPRSTGPNGELAMLLDAPMSVAPQGTLLVIEQSGPAETVVWSIPLQLAIEPAPTGMPGIDRAPAPPPATAPQSEIQRHQDEVARHRIKVVAQLRERIYEFWQAWDELDATISVLPLPPLPSASDDELWEAWQHFVKIFDLVVKGYEAAWRLYNLADLPTGFEPTLPFLASDLEKLRRAMDRFAFRHKQDAPIPLPEFWDDMDAYLTAMDGYLDEIIKTHDHRQSFAHE